MNEQVYLVQDDYFTELWYAVYYYDGKFSHIEPVTKDYNRHKEEMIAKLDRILSQIS